MILCVNEALNSSESRFQPPLTMMVISAVHADLLEEVVSVFYIRGSLYNLLLAYPYVTEHADPEPSSLLVDNFGGEWVWDRFGLLKGISLSLSLSTPYHQIINLIKLLFALPLQIQGLPTMRREDRTQAVKCIFADYAIFLPTALMISPRTSKLSHMQIR